MNRLINEKYANGVVFDGNNPNVNTHLSGDPIVGKGKPQSIADFNQYRGRHIFLQMTQQPKKNYGYKEQKIYPRVTYALGSSEYTNIGTNRAVGPCKHGGRSAYYGFKSDKQKPIFRNKDIRLQFPHFQQMVCDHIQVPPKMYGEYSQRISRNLVL
jgi:hypothetical protein